MNVMARMNLSGKVVMVTGAAGGIGLATSKMLHERGASVVLVDLDTAAAEAAAAQVGERAIGLAADVTDLAAMQSAVKATVERFGGLDVCVANAGIPCPVASARSVDPAAFDRVVEIDLLGVWRTVRAALPEVVQRRGHLVLVSSVYAFMPGMLAASYGASKAAVESLGRSLRIELAPYGATATVARFGFVKTASFEDALADPIAIRLEKMAPKPMRKRLTPDDAAIAITRGIERRAAGVTIPRWGRLWSAGRGFLNPIADAAFARDPRLHAIIRDIDRAGSS